MCIHMHTQCICIENICNKISQMRKHGGQKGLVQEKYVRMAGKSEPLVNSTPKKADFLWCARFI